MADQIVLKVTAEDNASAILKRIQQNSSSSFIQLKGDVEETSQAVLEAMKKRADASKRVAEAELALSQKVASADIDATQKSLRELESATAKKVVALQRVANAQRAVNKSNSGEAERKALDEAKAHLKVATAAERTAKAVHAAAEKKVRDTARAEKATLDEAKAHLRSATAMERAAKEADKLARAKERAEQGTKKLSGSTPGLLAMGGALAAGATSAVLLTQGLVRASSASLNAASLVQNQLRGMELVHGSAEAAVKRLDELNELAKLPGMDRNTLIQYNNQLSALGATTQEIDLVFEAVGKGVTTFGGNMHDVRGIMLQYAQAAGKGTATLGDFKPIIERMPTFLIEANKALGTGEQSWDAFKGALDASIASGKSWHEAMTPVWEQIATLPGADIDSFANRIDNLGDTFFNLQVAIGDKFLPIAGDIIGMVSNVLEYIQGLIEGNNQLGGTWGEVYNRVQPLLDAFGSLGTALWELIKSILPALKFGWEYVGAVIAAHIIVIENLVKALAWTIDKASDFINWVRGIEAESDKMAESVNKSAEAVKDAGDAQKQLGDKLSDTKKKLEQVNQALADKQQRYQDLINKGANPAHASMQHLERGIESLKAKAQELSGKTQELQTSIAGVGEKSQASKTEVENWGLAIAHAKHKADEAKDAMSEVIDPQKTAQLLTEAKESINDYYDLRAAHINATVADDKKEETLFKNKVAREDALADAVEAANKNKETWIKQNIKANQDAARQVKASHEESSKSAETEAQRMITAYQGSVSGINNAISQAEFPETIKRVSEEGLGHVTRTTNEIRQYIEDNPYLSDEAKAKLISQLEDVDIESKTITQNTQDALTRIATEASEDRNSVVQAELAKFETASDSAMRAFEDSIKNAKTVEEVRTQFGNVKTGLEEIAGEISRNTELTYEESKRVATQLFEDVVSASKTANERVTAIEKTELDKRIEQYKGNKDDTIDAYEDLVDGLKQKLQDADTKEELEAINQEYYDSVEQLLSDLEGAIDTSTEEGKELYDDLIEYFDGKDSDWQSIFERAMKKLGKEAGKAAKDAQREIDALADDIEGLFQDAIDFIAGLIDGDTSIEEAFKDLGVRVGGKLTDSIIEELSEYLAPKIMEILNGLDLGGAGEGLGEQIADAAGAGAGAAGAGKTGADVGIGLGIGAGTLTGISTIIGMLALTGYGAYQHLTNDDEAIRGRELARGDLRYERKSSTGRSLQNTINLPFIQELIASALSPQAKANIIGQITDALEKDAPTRRARESVSDFTERFHKWLNEDVLSQYADIDLTPWKPYEIPETTKVEGDAWKGTGEEAGRSNYRPPNSRWNATKGEWEPIPYDPYAIGTEGTGSGVGAPIPKQAPEEEDKGTDETDTGSDPSKASKSPRLKTFRFGDEHASRLSSFETEILNAEQAIKLLTDESSPEMVTQAYTRLANATKALFDEQYAILNEASASGEYTVASISKEGTALSSRLDKDYFALANTLTGLLKDIGYELVNPFDETVEILSGAGLDIQKITKGVKESADDVSKESDKTLDETFRFTQAQRDSFAKIRREGILPLADVFDDLGEGDDYKDILEAYRNFTGAEKILYNQQKRIIENAKGITEEARQTALDELRWDFEDDIWTINKDLQGILDDAGYTLLTEFVRTTGILTDDVLNLRSQGNSAETIVIPPEEPVKYKTGGTVGYNDPLKPPKETHAFSAFEKGELAILQGIVDEKQAAVDLLGEDSTIEEIRQAYTELANAEKALYDEKIKFIDNATGITETARENAKTLAGQVFDKEIRRANNDLVSAFEDIGYQLITAITATSGILTDTALNIQEIPGKVKEEADAKSKQGASRSSRGYSHSFTRTEKEIYLEPIEWRIDAAEGALRDLGDDATREEIDAAYRKVLEEELALHNEKIRLLDDALAQGRITQDQYNQSIVNLGYDYQDQIEDANRDLIDALADAGFALIEAITNWRAIVNAEVIRAASMIPGGGKMPEQGAGPKAAGSGGESFPGKPDGMDTFSYRMATRRNRAGNLLLPNNWWKISEDDARHKDFQAIHGKTYTEHAQDIENRRASELGRDPRIFHFPETDAMAKRQGAHIAEEVHKENARDYLKHAYDGAMSVMEAIKIASAIKPPPSMRPAEMSHMTQLADLIGSRSNPPARQLPVDQNRSRSVSDPQSQQTQAIESLGVIHLTVQNINRYEDEDIVKMTERQIELTGREANYDFRDEDY